MPSADTSRAPRATSPVRRRIAAGSMTAPSVRSRSSSGLKRSKRSRTLGSGDAQASRKAAARSSSFNRPSSIARRSRSAPFTVPSSRSIAAASHRIAAGGSVFVPPGRPAIQSSTSRSPATSGSREPTSGMCPAPCFAMRNVRTELHGSPGAMIRGSFNPSPPCVGATPTAFILSRGSS